MFLHLYRKKIISQFQVIFCTYFIIVLGENSFLQLGIKISFHKVKTSMAASLKLTKCTYAEALVIWKSHQNDNF